MTDAAQIIRANHADSIRLARPDGTTVQIPVKCVLAIDRVLRRCFQLDDSLSIEPVVDDDTNGEGWQAMIDMGVGAASDMRPTPWQAVLSLAEKLRRDTP